MCCGPAAWCRTQRRQHAVPRFGVAGGVERQQYGEGLRVAGLGADTEAVSAELEQKDFSSNESAE